MWGTSLSLGKLSVLLFVFLVGSTLRGGSGAGGTLRGGAVAVGLGGEWGSWKMVVAVGRMRVGLLLSAIQDCRQGLGGIQNHAIKADCRVSATCIPSTHSTHNSVDNS
jgi:hypothetical protein